MYSDSRNYENALSSRKTECTFLWASRQLTPQVAYKQVPRPTPLSQKEDVLRSRKIQELLDVISAKQNVPKPQLESQVQAILNEIGYNKNLKLIRWIAVVLTKILLRISTGIFVNIGNLQHLKSEMESCPVIFVPSHRSYGDFILMSWLCFTYDVEIPAIAAGMDFYSMWGMGTMLRDTGAFFMRRSYNDDSLYWTTFKQYVHQLITHGDLPIEFFIEGTRSRSNKSLSPKYGLISMILKSFFLSEVPDILFVPINITYDRILEESLFAFELLGVPKPKETTSGFFKSLKIVKEKYGNMYVHFDKPISARSFFGDQLDSSTHNLGPLHQQEISEKEKTLIPPLACEIVHRQQKCSTITIFSLMSLVLSNNLANSDQLLTIEQLMGEIIWLKGVIEFLGAFVHTENIDKSVEECFIVHENLVEVTPKNTVHLVHNNIVLDKINPTKLKAHFLSEKTMSYSVPFVMLQIYINPTLQYFVDAALLVIILGAKGVLNKEELFNKYHFLRTFFAMEFVYIPPRDRMDFETAIQQSLVLNVIQSTPDPRYELGTDTKLQQFLGGTLEPFLTSYLITLLILERLPVVSDEKTILSNIQRVLENKINNDSEFLHPYCLNLDTLYNCLNSLASMGAIVKTRSGNKVVYEINVEKIVKIRKQIEDCFPKCHVEVNIDTQLSLQNKL